MVNIEILSKEQKERLIKAIKQEIKELEKLEKTEDNIPDMLYEYLRYQKDGNYVIYNLEKLLDNLEEDERFKLGMLLILSSFYPFGFNLYSSLKA